MIQIFELLHPMRVQGVEVSAYDGKKIGNETSVLIFYCSSLCGGSTELFSDEEIWTSHVGLEETVLFIY